jgi:hypothetical protein
VSLEGHTKTGDLMTIVQLKTKVNKETGEILDRQQRDLPDYFNPDNGYRLFARTKSMRTFPAIDFPKELSRVDMGHLLFLTRSMWSNTGCVGLLKNRKFRPFNDEDLYKHIGFTYDRKGKEWIKRMVKMSMLRSIDINLPEGLQERQWYVNPVYFCPMFINRQTYLIWRDQIEKFVPEYIKNLFG